MNHSHMLHHHHIASKNDGDDNNKDNTDNSEGGGEGGGRGEHYNTNAIKIQLVKISTTTTTDYNG